MNNNDQHEICDNCAHYLDRTLEKEIYELAKICSRLMDYRPIPLNGFQQAPYLLERAGNMMSIVETERLHLRIRRLEKENEKMFRELQNKDKEARLEKLALIQGLPRVNGNIHLWLQDVCAWQTEELKKTY